ncbi:MAG: PAS domain-containing protein [Desulfobacteraceae bacterium]|nr:PAS domain-containing protein [Desulfobacteraceae bacterium]
MCYESDYGKTDSYRIEKRYIHKNGSMVWADLSVTGIRDKDNNIVKLIGAGFDITERKHAETRLRQSEENLKEAQHIGNVGHWEYDPICSKLFWSDQMFRIYGLSPDSFTPTYDSVVALFHPDDRRWWKMRSANRLWTKQNSR